jgi:hypothetical protein
MASDLGVAEPVGVHTSIRVSLMRKRILDPIDPILTRAQPVAREAFEDAVH